MQRPLETCAPVAERSTDFSSGAFPGPVGGAESLRIGAGTTRPASRVTTTSHSAASAARWVMTSTLRSPAAARTPTISSSARAGSRPLVGSSSTRTGPGASSARATARRRRSPPDRATPSSPTGVSSPSGRAAIQASRRAVRSASVISASVASGRPRTRLDRTVPANICARWSASAQAGARVGLAQVLHVGVAKGQRAVLEWPVAQQRGDQARLAGAARAGHGDPAAGRQPHAHRVEGAGKAGVVAQGGVGENHVRHALGRRQRVGRVTHRNRHVLESEEPLGRGPHLGANGPPPGGWPERSRRWPTRPAGAPPP